MKQSLLLSLCCRAVASRIGFLVGMQALVTAFPYKSQLHHAPLTSSTRRFVSNYVSELRDADFYEQMVGGKRYEMIPLPDSMVETTLFVGNLNEFVDDDDLSELFQSVSKLKSLPACVARKVNNDSMSYGFVSFPCKQEKELAIQRFNGMEWKGKRIKVEAIRDHAVGGRVRVPGRLINFVSGELKKTRNGQVNTLRRISKDDVERLSRGQAARKRGSGSRNVPHRLNEEERQELERAARKGYVSLAGTGYRRGRKGSPLANIHRQWCDARAKPQIVLCKASGGRMLDSVIVDLSPLRLLATGGSQDKWNAEIQTVANSLGMMLRTDYEQDNTMTEEDALVDMAATVWAKDPVWKLPVLSIGVFEGERQKAKAMAKELAVMWEIPEIQLEKQKRTGRTNRKGGKTKMKGISEHRRRSGRRDLW